MTINESEVLFIKETLREISSGRNICLSIAVQIFIAGRPQVQIIQINHLILKNILELGFQFLKDLEGAYNWIAEKF